MVPANQDEARFTIAVLTSVGGTLDTFFPEIVDYWESLGARVVTAASTASDVGEFTALRAVTRRPSIRNVRAPAEIREWLVKTEASVLVTNTATASALARIRPMPTPIIYFCHGLHWNEGRTLRDRMWQGIEGRLAQRTDGVISINSDDEEWFRTRLPSEQVLKLSRGVGVPLNNYPLSKRRRGESLELLWVGEFSKRKRPFEALEVLRALCRSEPDARLTMLGSGQLHGAVMDKAAVLGLQDRVSFPGRGDFVSFMADSDALLHTAKWEGLPRVMLEAYAMGRQSYAYDVKGVRDVPGAILVRDLRPQELAALISNSFRSTEMAAFSPNLTGLSTEDSAKLIYEFLLSISRNASD